MKFLSIILTAILLLISCNKVNNFQQLSNMQRYLKTKGGYDSYLALEYLEFSRSLYAAQDKKNGEYFARKGVYITQGIKIVPESPMQWGADKAQIEEMLMMQKRLEVVLSESQAKTNIPIQLSHLTYLYDCWMARESKEVFRTSDLAYCKTRFYKLLDEVENYIEDSKKNIAPKVTVKIPEFRRFEVSFDSKSVKINDEAAKKIIEALQYIAGLNDVYKVLVVGNNDGGEKLYDKNLSLNRANIVRDYLIKNGILESAVEVKASSEDFPDVIANQGEDWKSNRKVGIYVLKGVDSSAQYPMPLVRSKIYQNEIKEVRQKRGLSR